MQKIKSFMSVVLIPIAAIGLAVVGAPSAAHALPITTPTDLASGDQYRLAFVTSTTTAATSSSIAYYNDFVTAAANTQPLLAGLGTTWSAIASTFTANAITNTGTQWMPSSLGLPIYRLDGSTRVAANYMNLWTGYLETALRVTEAGTDASNSYVWTGTGQGGSAWQGGLGYTGPIFGKHAVGHNFFTSGLWIRFAGFGPAWSEAYPLYAISGVLTVPTSDIPEPGTLGLFGVGLAIFAVARRRTRNAPFLTSPPS